jgi:hypothetical protein
MMQKKGTAQEVLVSYDLVRGARGQVTRGQLSGTPPSCLTAKGLPPALSGIVSWGG